LPVTYDLLFCDLPQTNIVINIVLVRLSVWVLYLLMVHFGSDFEKWQAVSQSSIRIEYGNSLSTSLLGSVVGQLLKSGCGSCE
jgi:hypothetical protein